MTLARDSKQTFFYLFGRFLAQGAILKTWRLFWTYFGSFLMIQGQVHYLRLEHRDIATIETSETSTLCVETRQMAGLATEDMSSVETGQMSSVETEQMFLLRQDRCLLLRQDRTDVFCCKNRPLSCLTSHC